MHYRNFALVVGLVIFAPLVASADNGVTFQKDQLVTTKVICYSGCNQDMESKFHKLLEDRELDACKSMLRKGQVQEVPAGTRVKIFSPSTMSEDWGLNTVFVTAGPLRGISFNAKNGELKK